MSQVKRGRAWTNEGPAHQEGSLGVLTPNMAAGGGVERRQVWAALHDVSAEEAREARLTTSGQTEAQRLESSRRGGEATRQKHPWRAALPPVREEPVMDIAAPQEPTDVGSHLESALDRINTASLEAIEALTDVRVAERRWKAATEALTAAYRAAGLLPTAEAVEVVIDAGAELRELVHDGHATARRPSAVEVESPADHAETIPLAAPSKGNGAAKASGDPAGLTPGQRRILDALVGAAGERPATAALLGLQPQSLDASIAQIRKVGGDRLTSEEAAIVAIKRRRPA